ncbi:MAG: hypothetical protein RIA69_18690 [Cyclobacteriaceae bacterium]
MKKGLILFAVIFFTLASYAQDGEKKFKIKKPNFNIGEKISKLAGSLMTGKTSDLSAVSVKSSYVCGMYSPSIETSEVKFFKGKLREGDYLLTVTFMKQDGVGLLEILGTVKANGEPMEYVGLGSYGRIFEIPPTEPVKIEIETETGDKASFLYEPIEEIEFVSVKGEAALPVLDLEEDFELVFYNPPGTEGTDVRVSLITDVMGTRALNHFAEFKVKTAGEMKVTIPKEALANPEIAGQLNMGNFNKGENHLIIEREVILPKNQFGANQNPNKIPTAEIKRSSYATMPVILKGKQDGGLVVALKVAGQSPDKTIGFDFTKPNANSGIPLSKASKFGLVSFTMDAVTYKRETEESSSSYVIGDTKYTTTTTTTTTYQFPQLPDAYWDGVMDAVYKEVVAFLNSEYSISFVPVEDVISTPEYSALFKTNEVNTEKKVQRSYKNTFRSSPKSIIEIFGSLSSNMTEDNPTVLMMKNAGDLDGLVSMSLTLVIGESKTGSIVLFPTLNISAYGRDEENDNKQGTYFNGRVVRTVGESFNEDKVKTNPNELLRVVSYPEIMNALEVGIKTIRLKEIEMGFDRIWSIGE